MDLPMFDFTKSENRKGKESLPDGAAPGAGQLPDLSREERGGA